MGKTESWVEEESALESQRGEGKRKSWYPRKTVEIRALVMKVTHRTRARHPGATLAITESQLRDQTSGHSYYEKSWNRRTSYDRVKHGAWRKMSQVKGQFAKGIGAPQT